VQGERRQRRKRKKSEQSEMAMRRSEMATTTTK